MHVHIFLLLPKTLSKIREQQNPSKNDLLTYIHTYIYISEIRFKIVDEFVLKVTYSFSNT